MWIINDSNDRYPVNENGVSYVPPAWSGVLPNLLWRIINGKNDNYPTKPMFVEAPKYSGNIAVGQWRIYDGVNDNYPYKWYQMAVATDYINQGDVVIGSDSDMKIWNDDNQHKSDPDSDKSVNPSSRNGASIGLHLNNRLGTFSGFLTMYNMNYQQLSNFGSALMGNPLNYRGNFQKDLSEELSGTYDVSSILDYIVSVKQYPFSVATLANTTTLGTSSIYIGTGEFGVPIGTACRILTSSISVVNAGSMTVNPIDPYNDFRDYYNTSVVAYLPYCGTVQLNPMEIIGSYLECYYLIDFFTGECTAVLYSTYNNMSFPVGMANGNIGVDIPLSATNSGQLSAIKRMENNQKAQTVLSYVNSGIGMVENGASIAMATQNENDVEMIAGILNGITGYARTVTDIVSTAFSNSANPYGGNKSMRSSVGTPMMGTGSGATNFMLYDSAYIQIRRGTYSRPNNYPHTMGYPNSYSATLSRVSGYTVCQNVDVSGINATVEEKSAIKQALESGVIL